MILIQIFSRNVNQKVFQVVSYTAGIFGVKCFSIFCGLILVDSKSGEILMPNDLIALGFCSYKLTQFGGNVTS